MTVVAETPRAAYDSFFAAHQESVAELLDLLEVPVTRADDLEEVVAHTQSWVAGDHHTPTYEVAFAGPQERDARRLFEKMGLTDEQAPPAGEYGQVVILGGMMGVNNERTRYAAEQLARPDITLASGGEVIFLSGARMPQPREFPAISSSIIEAGDRVPHDAWLQNIYPGDEGRINEVSQGRLSLMIYFGRLALERMDLRLNDGEVVEGYQFTAEELGVGGLRCVIINGRPVSRTNVAGQPRPTTESCAQEWLTGNYAPQANVMLVSNNPHIRRTTASVEAVAKCHMGDDIAIYGCGPAAYDDAKTSLFLGEVGRLLYTDFMHQQRGKEGVY